jgi:hypothetical protein
MGLHREKLRISGVNIFSDDVQIHLGKKTSMVFSFGKNPNEFHEEIAKRRVAAEKNRSSEQQQFSDVGFVGMSPFDRDENIPDVLTEVRESISAFSERLSG